MRSMEQTYLAKMGFADPDRQNALHNAAAFYLAQDDKAEKFLKLMDVSIDSKPEIAGYSVNATLANNNYHSGYKNIVGFIDLVLRLNGSSRFQDLLVYIEIKTKFMDVSNIIQQMNFYRSYIVADRFHDRDRSRFVVCTLYPMSENDKKALLDQGYYHIYVSETSVQKFISSQGVSNQEF